MSQPKRPRSKAAEPDTDDRWWVIVVSKDPELGSGRYGVWEHKPTVTIASDNDTAIVKGQPQEPTLYVCKAQTLTFVVAQAKHLNAQPLGEQNAAAES